MAIEVLKKAFRILECMAESVVPLALGEISRRVNMPKPTVYRVLQTMLELGYVAQEDQGGAYLRTSQLERIGHDSRIHDLKYRVLHIMNKLFERFNETVNLGVLIGVNVHYIHFINTTRSLRHMVQPGSIDPFYSTALGRAIAAYLPEEEKTQLIEIVNLETVTPYTIKSKAKLRQQLNEIHRRGWAIDDQENDLGVICLGAPILEKEYPVAAISITIPKTRHNDKMQKEILKELLKALKMKKV
ncbi:MAG: IclR family transcriptional regulator [Sedimentisphaerales bacterium]|nr:IclR family transcriptional regulator [Sedimentisphaerales bacterium]